MRTAHQWIICLKPVRSEGWDCASNKCQSDSVHLHNSRQLGTNRLGPDKRRNRPCEVLELDLSGFPTYQDLARRARRTLRCRSLPAATIHLESLSRFAKISIECFN